MLFPKAAYVVCLLSVVTADALLDIYKEMGKFSHEVNSFKEVTPALLFKQGVIRVKNHDSVIVSEYLIEKATDVNFQAHAEQEKAERPNIEDPRKFSFIQTDFSSAIFLHNETEWLPIDGCVDNSRSETITSITKSYSARNAQSIAPSIAFLLLGITWTPGLSASFSRSRSEKLSCDVGPGETLQVQAKSDTVSISHLRQRNIQISKGFVAYFDTLSATEWKTVPEDATYYATNYKTACVTDPTLLKCSFEIR